MAKSVSNYRALRVFMTQEKGGWVTIRVAVKPVDSDWSVMHQLVSHRYRPAVAPDSLRDALDEVVDFLQQAFLPTE